MKHYESINNCLMGSLPFHSSAEFEKFFTINYSENPDNSSLKKHQ